MKHCLKRIFFVFLLFSTILFPLHSPGQEKGDVRTFETEGMAAVIGSDLARAREGAVRDALQKAVEQATEQWLTLPSEGRREELLRERIYGRAEEFVQDYRILFEMADEDIYFVTVRATVIANEIRKDLQELGLVEPPAANPATKRMILTIRGIRGYGDYVRVKGALKAKESGIREAIPREASPGAASFDIVVEGAAATAAEALKKRLAADLSHQDDRLLELRLK